RAFIEANDPDAEGDPPAAPFEFPGECAGHQPEVDEPRSGQMQGGDARTVRLELPEALGANAHNRHSVRRSAALQFGEAPELTIVGRDDDLAANLVRDSRVVAEMLELQTSARAELRFQGAGRVVHAGMDDAAASAGLVRRRTRLLLEDENVPVGPAPTQFARARQADDAGPHDDGIDGTGQALAE